MNKLQEIIDFFECEEGYDKSEVIEEILNEIKQLKGYASDEIGLEYDGKTLMVLNDFIEGFYQEIIVKVCNVLKSFEDEEETVI